MKNISNGVILFQGDSLYNNEPIVVIMTGLHTPSNNTKTGDMLQTYVLNRDILPTEAIKKGKDEANCGDCPLRGKSGDRICYVNLIGVNNVWNYYKKGNYPYINDQILKRIKLRKRSLRITSYGEAAYTPFDIWQPLLNSCKNNTGYTHAYRSSNIDPRWKNYLMASVETETDARLAQQNGWRTFRIKNNDDKLLPDEIICPNSVDKDIICKECNLCNGLNSKTNLNIVNNVHGLHFKINNFKTIDERLCKVM